MSEPVGAEPGMGFARSRALAVLRVRGFAAAAALLPAAVAVVLFAADATGLTAGAGWEAARWAVTVPAAAVLMSAAAVAVVVARARPAVSPTVAVAEKTAPDLYRLVRDLADRLGVPAPSAIAVTPDCDSWLEDRAHLSPAGRGGRAALRRAAPEPPELVIGSPFLWWMRVAELRALLAPVVAGTDPSAHPDIAAARRFVRGLDAAVAVSARHRALTFVGWVSRLMLRGCRGHAAEMERGVAYAASSRAQDVDFGLRIVAQEQVGLAFAGWDRLLTRVALPAWRMGRWPSRLDAGVVSALTELSRRDRLADGFAARLGERPACDLLEEPGAVDEAASLLAARLFHGGPAERGPDWAPVDWDAYPEEVVDRKWRLEAARLHQILDELSPAGPAGPAGPALDEVLDHLAAGDREEPEPRAAGGAGSTRGPGPAGEPRDGGGGTWGATPPGGAGGAGAADAGDAGDAAADRGADGAAGEPVDTGSASAAGAVRVPDAAGEPCEDGRAGGADRLPEGIPREGGLAERLAARLEARIAREAAGAAGGAGTGAGDGPRAGGRQDGDGLPIFPLQPPRSGRELLADHVLATVCCAAVDTAGAVPGLDWLDGPVLLFGGSRGADLVGPVLSLVEEGDAVPLREWIAAAGVRADKPVRLV